MTSQDPTDSEPRQESAAVEPGMPILVRPVPGPKVPNAIGNARVLTWGQIALVMICGNCSFGWPLFAAFSLPADRFNWSDDPAGFAIPWAWAVGFAAIFTYAYFVNRWADRADRRARTTIIIGTAVLVSLTIAAIVMWGWAQSITPFILLTSAPSLIVQAIVLGLVYSSEAQRWFSGRWSVAPEP